eukprot:gene12916-13043_t
MLTSEAPSFSLEICKLQNVMKVKDKELDAAHREVTILKANNPSTEDGRHRSIEGARFEGRGRKLESTVSDLQRNNDRLKEKVAVLTSKTPTFNEHLASLQAEMRLMKQANAQLTEDHKAACSMIRAKDRELGICHTRLQAAAAVEARAQFLEGELSTMRVEQEQTAVQKRTLVQVQRQKEADISFLNKLLDTTKGTLESNRQELAAARAALKVAEDRVAELRQELSVTRDELARATTVAGKAAAAEARLVKGEGMVPAGKGSGQLPAVCACQHCEEVKYLNGQLMRLKEKLAVSERDLAVAHQIKSLDGSFIGLPLLGSEASGIDIRSPARRPRSSIGSASRRASGRLAGPSPGPGTVAGCAR